VLAESGVALLAVATTALEDARESARAALGEAGYATAHARGRALPVEGVLAETGALEPS
jgi:hypothetical protein